MHVIIRADASIEIGAGHIMRCLALADQLKDSGNEVAFICREHQGNFLSYINQKGFQTYSLPKPLSSKIGKRKIDPSHTDWLGVQWEIDAQETVSKFIGKDIDWLIVDHYAIDNRWLTYTRPYVKHIMVIDDLADRLLDCDLLLDQTYGRDTSVYLSLIPKKCRILAGSDYALLRPQFAQRRKEALEKRAKTDRIRNILICMGSMDPDNITAKIIDVLKQLFSGDSIEILVVLGKDAPFLEEIYAKSTTSSFRIKVYVNINNIEELMIDADLAIGAGGTSSWERCCLGLPTLTIITADNQKEVAKNLARSGAIINLGDVSSFSYDTLSKCLENIISRPDVYSEMVLRSAEIVDGLGVERTVSFIRNYDNGITLRNATLGDREIIYKWQSEPSTRRYFRNPKIPSWQEHQAWFKEIITDSEKRLFVIERKTEPVGVIRLDPLNQKEKLFEISIVIAPECRGKGIGVNALKYLRTIQPRLDFLAEVSEKNLISRNLFKSAGFIQIDKIRYLSKA